MYSKEIFLACINSTVDFNFILGMQKSGSARSLLLVLMCLWARTVVVVVLFGLVCFSFTVEGRGTYLFQMFQMIESRQAFPYFKIPYQNEKNLGNATTTFW